MILTLSASCIRSLLTPASKGAKPALALLDLPAHTREVFGLRGLNLSSDLLAGADRRSLEALRERADKAGCACLVLVEPQIQKLAQADESKVAAMLDRMARVAQAAQLLGCSSAAFVAEGFGTEETRTLSAKRLRVVVERAEKLDLNILVGPAAVTPLIEPDAVTDLLKRVGGFRIGTFPDFETAAKAKDPVTYLRRLSPYDSAICAATMAFKPGESALPPRKPSKPSAASKTPLILQELGLPPKKGKAAKAAPPPPVVAPPDEELDDELNELDLAELGLEEGEEGAASDAPAEPVPVHVGYDVAAMVQAVASVGYDGALAVDYRGSGDITLGVLTSRRVLQAALESAYLEE
ncbi:MAG: hypothetical protein AABZ53_12265 [Planctomycetota bacterium]